MFDWQAEFKVTASPGTRIRLSCVSCDSLTNHLVLTQVDESGYHEYSGIHWRAQYQIVQCQGCEVISFRKDTHNSEDMYVSPDGEWKHVHHEDLFPRRITGRKELSNQHLLPHPVQRIYGETHEALSNELRVLAGIGIRALVESVCKEKSAPGRNLEQKIDGLVNIGVLTKAGAEILHGTRLLGNKATHEQKPLSMDVLNAAMEVAEHLLHSVYLLPAIAAKLPQRKQLATKSADGTTDRGESTDSNE